jgi:hypothetical protein
MFETAFVKKSLVFVADDTEAYKKAKGSCDIPP